MKFVADSSLLVRREVQNGGEHRDGIAHGTWAVMRTARTEGMLFLELIELDLLVRGQKSPDFRHRALVKLLDLRSPLVLRERRVVPDPVHLRMSGFDDGLDLRLLIGAQVDGAGEHRQQIGPFSISLGRIGVAGGGLARTWPACFRSALWRRLSGCRSRQTDTRGACQHGEHRFRWAFHDMAPAVGMVRGVDQDELGSRVSSHYSPFPLSPGDGVAAGHARAWRPLEGTSLCWSPRGSERNDAWADCAIGNGRIR